MPNVICKNTYTSAVGREKIRTTVRGGRGRFVEIIFDECSPLYQAKIVSALGDPREILGITGSGDTAKGKKVPFAELTPAEFAVCNSKYNMVKQFRAYADKFGPELGVKAAKDEFVALIRDGYLCKEEVTIVGSVSFPTIERWNKELREGGDIIDALAPFRAEKKGRQLTPQQRGVLIECYCKDSKPSYSQAYRLACKVYKVHYPDDAMVSEVTAARFLREFERTNAAVVRARREGFKVSRDTQLPYLERDPEQIQFMDCLVADGKTLNFQIAHPEHGRPCRATLIGFQDFRTGRLMGFEIMVTENTKSVLSAFAHACKEAARLLGSDGAVMPKTIYLDNGRAFKNNTLGGQGHGLYTLFKEGTNFEKDLGGIFDRLKPYGLEQVLYARPYNARTKTIERTWQMLDEGEQMVVSYLGKSISDKPASLKRNEAFHRLEREKAIAKNGLPTLHGAYQIMQFLIDEYNNSIGEGKYLNGYTPNQLAVEQITQIDFSPRMLPYNGLDYMMLHSKTLKLRRNGFSINGISYYNTMFANIEKHGVSTEYIVKYSLFDASRVLVFYENGEFMCEAKQFWGADLHPVAVLGSAEDQAKVAKANIILGNIEKSVKKAAFGAGTTNMALALSEVYDTGISPPGLLPPAEPVPTEEPAPALALWSQD